MLTDIALFAGTAIGYLLSPLRLIIIYLCGSKINSVRRSLGISFLSIFILDLMNILFLSDLIFAPVTQLATSTVIGLPFALLLTFLVFKHYDKKRRIEEKIPVSQT